MVSHVAQEWVERRFGGCRKEIAAAPTSDPSVHLLMPRHPTRDNELTMALTTMARCRTRSAGAWGAPDRCRE